MNKDSTIQEGIQGLGNCARCGWEFVCGMRAGMGTCWCIELPTLRDADPGAGDCYCPDCLKALITER